MSIALALRPEETEAGEPPAALHPGRILILVENLPVPADRRVWQEANALRRAGHEVTVICPATDKWPKRHEVIDGIAIYRHWLPEARGALAYPVEYAIALVSQTILAWYVFLTRGFDVVQACNPPDLLFLVAAPFKLFGRKFVFDHHDLAPELFSAKFGRRKRLLGLLLGAERSTFRLADGVISTDEEFRRIAIERGGKDPADVSVVLSTPDKARLTAGEADPRLRNGRRHVALYVGVMGNQDGVDLLLEAAASLRDRYPDSDVQWVLAGDGPEKPSLEARAAALGLGDRVAFLGYVTGAALTNAFLSADIGICPDPKNGFNEFLTMNKILEYMTFGIPMVGFDLMVSRQLAGEAGCFVGGNAPAAMADAVHDLLENAPARARMGAIGRERVKGDLGWPAQARTLVAFYDRVLAGRKPA